VVDGMSSTDQFVRAGDGEAVLPPYTPDHGSRAYRRGRLAAFILVAVLSLFYGMTFALFAPYLIMMLIAPFAVGAVVVVWALPDMKNAPTRLIAPLLFALIFLVVMWPNYIAIALPGLPWITMERLDGIPLVLTVLLCLSTSPEFRARSADALKAARYIIGFFLAFLVIQTLSIAWSTNKVQSIDRYFVAQLGWTSVFFASVYVFLKPGRVQRMAAMLWGAGIGVGLIAVAEWREQHVLWAGHIPSFLQIQDPTVAHSLYGGDRFGAYRVKSTFGTVLGLGEYTALILPFVLHFATGDYKVVTRLLAAASAVFVVFVAVLSGARVGTLGCLAGATLYLFVWSVLKWRRHPNSLVGPALVAGYPLVAGLFLGSTLVIGRLRNMFWGNGAEKLSNQSRIDQINLGIPKIISHPWGYGVGMGGDALGYAPLGMLTIDNYYLDIVLDYGIVGFIFYYGIFVAAIAYCIRFVAIDTTRSPELSFIMPLGISLIVFALIKSSFSETSNHPIVFAMLGAVVALVYRAKSEEADAMTRPVPVVEHEARVSRPPSEISTPVTGRSPLSRPIPPGSTRLPPRPGG
jgi:hypothetical protein